MITRHQLISIILQKSGWDNSNRIPVALMSDNELYSVFPFFNELRTGYYVLSY